MSIIITTIIIITLHVNLGRCEIVRLFHFIERNRIGTLNVIDVSL